MNRPALKHFSHNGILEAQKQDKVIGRVFHHFKINCPPTRQERAKEAPCNKTTTSQMAEALSGHGWNFAKENWSIQSAHLAQKVPSSSL